MWLLNRESLPTDLCKLPGARSFLTMLVHQQPSYRVAFVQRFQCKAMFVKVGEHSFGL